MYPASKTESFLHEQKQEYFTLTCNGANFVALKWFSYTIELPQLEFDGSEESEPKLIFCKIIDQIISLRFLSDRIELLSF